MNLLQNSVNVDGESFLPSLAPLPDPILASLARRFIILFSSGHFDSEINEEITTMKDKNLKKLEDAGKAWVKNYSTEKCNLSFRDDV